MIVVRSEIIDIFYLKDRLREEDVTEVRCSLNATPEEALGWSYLASDIRYTIFHEEEPVAMFGCAPMSDGTGCVWLLGADLHPIRHQFIRQTRKYLNEMLERYPFLFNFVDARYTQSLKWLKMLGAEIEEARPYGPFALPFHHISFRKGERGNRWAQ